MTNAETIDISTLTDGGQSSDDVLTRIEEFLAGAERSLILRYDLNVGPENAERLRAAVRAAVARGVAVRFLYNVDHRNPIPVPPPPSPTRS